MEIQHATLGPGWRHSKCFQGGRANRASKNVRLYLRAIAWRSGNLTIRGAHRCNQKWATSCHRRSAHKGGFDHGMTTRRSLKGPIFSAIQDCPTTLKFQMLKLLLERGVDLNRSYSAGRGTTLHSALQISDIEIAEMLLKYDANANGKWLHCGIRKH